MRNQFKAGYSVTEGDVATAEAQVFTTEAQAINALVQRAQFEHAIAILIGRPPAELSIGPHLLGYNIPRIPVTIPSALLERRPDIAAAERTMQEQNALIGVAVAGYFPDISLSAVLQWTGSQPAPFNVANIVWSLGASRHAGAVRRGIARRASRLPPARSTGKASPIIGRPCSPRFSRLRISSWPFVCSSSRSSCSRKR